MGTRCEKAVRVAPKPRVVPTLTLERKIVVIINVGN